MLAHTIEALVGTEIQRVHCNTCNRPHKYRPNAPGEKRAATKKRSASTSQRAKSASKYRASDYQDVIKNRDLDAAENYSMRKFFEKGDLLSHGKFGIGFVTSHRDGKKIEVLFEEGAKILIHARV